MIPQPYKAKNGSTFRPYQTEYAVSIDEFSERVHRRWDTRGQKLKAKIDSLGLGIRIALHMEWDGPTFFITILSKFDTPDVRDMIGEIIDEHLDHCLKLENENAR